MSPVKGFLAIKRSGQSPFNFKVMKRNSLVEMQKRVFELKNCSLRHPWRAPLQALIKA
jgi:hypothetical protein